MALINDLSIFELIKLLIISAVFPVDFFGALYFATTLDKRLERFDYLYLALMLVTSLAFVIIVLK